VRETDDRPIARLCQEVFVYPCHSVALPPASLRTALVVTFALFSTISAEVTRAELPTAAALLAELGIGSAEIEKAKKGEFIQIAGKSSNERELTAGFAFLVKGVTPTELVKQMRSGELDRVDPNTLAFQVLSDDPRPEDFAKLALKPDPAAQAKAYLSAKAGGDLNLSAAEIASFQKLGTGATPAQVEATLRTQLFDRLQAYRKSGLAGIAPYARSGGATRSPADDLRSATNASVVLKKSAPTAYQLLLDYPKGKQAGTEETFRWSQISAHGSPAYVLTHSLYIPDGDAWLGVQRQFYVSSGYNSEQAVVAFLPVAGGTAVFYGNRTSTDQITGFGGGAKRSIGSKLLASQLEGLFEKVRKSAGGS
jgi:hypothetical protein